MTMGIVSVGMEESNSNRVHSPKPLSAGGVMSLAILLLQKDGKKRLLRLKEYGKSLLYLRTYRRYEAENPYEFPFAICLGVGYLVSFSVCGNLIK